MAPITEQSHRPMPTFSKAQSSPSRVCPTNHPPLQIQFRRDDILEDMRKAGDAASQRQRAADEAAARAKAQQSLNALNLQSDRPAQPYSAAPHNYPPPQQVS